VKSTAQTLEPGRVYRTRDLAFLGKNTPRLAKRLVGNGTLTRLGQGLFARPERSRFGAVPPADDELMRRFLDGTPFVFTGPDRWNALGLGTTAVFAAPLIYNKKRSGTFTLGGRRFVLRRVAFPEDPSPEWFAVDLFEHADQAGTSRADLTEALKRAIRRDAFDREQLIEMAGRYGTKETQKLIDSAVSAAAA
jgi:hypothetical protein